VYKLGTMGPRAAPAVPAIKERLEDRRPEIARAAAEALEKIQPDAARDDR
jgi:HEAT repeat protein